MKNVCYVIMGLGAFTILGALGGLDTNSIEVDHALLTILIGGAVIGIAAITQCLFNKLR